MAQVVKGSSQLWVLGIFFMGLHKTAATKQIQFTMGQILFPVMGNCAPLSRGGCLHLKCTSRTHEWLTWLALPANRFLFLLRQAVFLPSLLVGEKLIYFFPCCAHVLMYYSCCRTMVFGFNHANLFPERHLNKNIFSLVLAKCVSLHFQQNCVPLCASPPRSPPSPATNGCVGLCCTPVNLTHRVLLPRETQVNHLPHHTNGRKCWVPSCRGRSKSSHTFPLNALSSNHQGRLPT